MNKILEKKWLLFFIVFVYGSLMTIFMYYPTFALDGYCQLQEGFYGYSHLFDLSGRFFTSFLWKFFGIIHISHDVVSIFAHLLSITFLSIAVVEIIDSLKRYINDTFISKLILVLGAILVIFNPFTQGILVFEESFCMALSVLLSVLSAVIISEECTKGNFIKAVLLLICANFLYQGTISYFVPLVILINIFKNKDLSFNKYVEKNFKNIIIYVLVFGISCVVEYISLNLYLKIFGLSSSKVGHISIIANIRNIWELIIHVFSTMRTMIFPVIFNHSLCLLALIILFRCIIDFKNKYKYLIYTVVIFILSIIASFIPNIVMPTVSNYTAPRLLLVFGAAVGFIALCSLLLFDKREKDLNKYYLVLILSVTIYFFLCSSNSMLYNSYKDYQRYIYDRDYIKDIENVIINYEKESNNKIKEIYFKTSLIPNYLGVHYNINNIRVSSSGWGFSCGVRGMIDNSYKVKLMDDDIYNEMIDNGESVIFKDDKLFIILE